MNRIITNNPMVGAKYPNEALLLPNREDVYRVARDRVHLGAMLIAHPLSGGVPPSMNPYKSLIIAEPEDGDALRADHGAISLIENAQEAMRRGPGRIPEYDEATLADFQVLDLDIIDSALAGADPRFAR